MIQLHLYSLTPTLSRRARELHVALSPHCSINQAGAPFLEASRANLQPFTPLARLRGERRERSRERPWAGRGWG